MTSSLLDGLTVQVYGTSIPAWGDRWGYVNRMASHHNWALINGAEWSSRAVDAVGQATALGSPYRIDHNRKPHVVLVDASTNDAYGIGPSGMAATTTAIKSLASYALLEGIINVGDCGFPQSWTPSYGNDFIAGRNVTAGPGTTHTVPGFNRAGLWAFFYYGLSSGWNGGGSWSLLRDGHQLGTYSCSNRTSEPIPGENRAYTSSGRGARQWILCSEIVDVPATGQFTIRSEGGGGGPFFAGYGKINQGTDRQAPLVVLVEPVDGYDSGTNSTLNAYAQQLHQLAAALPHVVVARTRDAWDLDRMARKGDPLHPNALGSKHYQEAITRAVDGAVDAGWLPDTNLSP